jgi:hypothetical protein
LPNTLERQFHAAFQVIRLGSVGSQRSFQAVLHGQQLGGEAFHGEFVRARDVVLGAAADVLGFGLGPEPGIVMLGRLEFGRFQQRFQAGHGFLVFFRGVFLGVVFGLHAVSK